jgi:hypothetical protein
MMISLKVGPKNRPRKGYSNEIHTIDQRLRWTQDHMYEYLTEAITKHLKDNFAAMGTVNLTGDISGLALG